MKSVIIAFSNPLLANWMTTVLHRSGYNIEYSCKTAGDVIRVAEFCTSPVVICGFQFTDMTAEDLAEAINGRLAMVTVVLAHQRGLVERNDMVVVPYPVSPMELLQAVEQAERKAALDAARPDAGAAGKSRSAERPAEEKLIILKAKFLLMERNQMTESQAHRFLQKSSMDRGLKLIDAAKMVLENQLAV
jgi:response regulator NasT